MCVCRNSVVRSVVVECRALKPCCVSDKREMWFDCVENKPLKNFDWVAQ